MEGVFCLKARRNGNEGMQVKHGSAPPSANGFGHEDVVARNLHEYVRSERSGAGFDVAEVAIKGGERSAGADDAEVDRHASGPAEIILPALHQFPSEAFALARGTPPNQPQLTPIPPNPNEHP